MTGDPQEQEELAQNPLQVDSVRRETVPDPRGIARRTLCAAKILPADTRVGREAAKIFMGMSHSALQPSP
jgi:hypothetical protein